MPSEGIDLLTVDPTDAGAVAVLVSQLQRHLPEDQCHQLLSDLRAWERRLAAFRHELETSPEWREIEQWRRYIRDVTGREAA